MIFHSAFIFVSFLLSFYTDRSPVAAEINCPPAETITPCVCDDSTSTRLECSSVLRPSIIQEVFENAENYTFQEVHLRSVTLMYLPSVIFEKARIIELYIENSTFGSLFDFPPETTTLEKLQLDNTGIQRRGVLNSDILKNATSLKTLIVNGVDRTTRLGPTFSRNFPNSLKQIILSETGIKTILPDAFSGFPYLDKLEISSSKLSALTRDMFPRPFNVRFLYFDNNNISYIPPDLFTDMPDLQFLMMKNNNITEIPEAAFGNRQASIPYLRLDGNPLRCNCLLVWLMKNKPEIIGGTCHTPSHLTGKHLQDLRIGDFNC